MFTREVSSPESGVFPTLREIGQIDLERVRQLFDDVNRDYAVGTFDPAAVCLTDFCGFSSIMSEDLDVRAADAVGRANALLRTLVDLDGGAASLEARRTKRPIYQIIPQWP